MIRTIVLAAAATMMLAACADNNRYQEDRSGYYETNRTSNDYNQSRTEPVFRQSQSK